jgi:CheY-like chemotaxis protein
MMAKRVLVVAGREGVAPALQIQIELWGDTLDFALATSGNEALWEIRGSPYDLVLAPWQIPEMTGMEFAEVVQALSPATKVVLIGAPVTPALQSQADSLHLFALLPDVTPQEVAVVVSRALGVPLPRPRPAPAPPPKEAPAPAAPPPKARPAPAAPPQPAVPPAPKVTPAQKEAIGRALRDLLASIGPQVALLASAAGEPLVIAGSAGDLPLPALAAHAVSSLARAGDLARLLGDASLLGLSLFTGSRYDVYAFIVSEAAALVFVFDKQIVEGKLGSVWLYTRRVVEELRGVLSAVSDQRSA